MPESRDVSRFWRSEPMDYIECDVPQGQGYCCDNDCDCGINPIEYGAGLVYISDEVVEFRRDALTRELLREKLSRVSGGGYIPVASYEPILICEKAASARGLDTEVAAADAKTFWTEGKVPLRATPSSNTPQEASSESAPVTSPEDSHSAVPPEPLAEPPAFAPPEASASFVDDSPGASQNGMASEQSADQKLPDSVEQSTSTASDSDMGQVHDQSASSQDPEHASAPSEDPKPENDAFSQAMETADYQSDNRVSDVTAIGPPPSFAAPPQSQDPMPQDPAQEDSVSAQDIASAYADGPLAELAAKMAADQNPSQQAPETTHQGAPEKKKGKTTQIRSPFLEPESEDSEEPETVASFAEETGEKPRKKNKLGLIIGISAAAVLLLLAVGAFLIWQLLSVPDLQPDSVSKPESVVPSSEMSSSGSGPAEDQPPVGSDEQSNPEYELAAEKPQRPSPAGSLPETSPPVLKSSFFGRAYDFRDAAYHGSIRFSEVSGNGGSYRQTVSSDNSDKVYNVSGTFVYTDSRITFRPNGANTEVLWELEKLSDTRATFFDPRKTNRAASRVFLEAVR